MGNYKVEKRIKPTGGDFVVISICIILAVVIGLFLLSGSSSRGRQLLISHEGEIIHKYDLNAASGETFIEIDGDYHSVILVSGDQVGFVSSDCPHEDCVHTGMISKAGQVAVCLPNRVVIEIIGTEVDAVTG